MDEGDTTKIKLGKEQYEVEISKFAFEELLIPNNRKNNIKPSGGINKNYPEYL